MRSGLRGGRVTCMCKCMCANNVHAYMHRFGCIGIGVIDAVCLLIITCKAIGPFSNVLGKFVNL